MKKILVVLGIALGVAAVVCLAASAWYDRLGGMVMDAEGDFYSRTYRKYLLFRRFGIAFAVSSALALAAGILKR